MTTDRHGAVPDAQPDARDETRLERLDRNLGELTGELRVVVTGVQVLFAFLLVAPFDSGFERLGSFERAVYFVTLLLAALAAACAIAPAAHHRLLFRHNEKAHLVGFANRVSIAGLGFLAGAMSGSLMLVSDILFGLAAAIAVVATAGLLFATLWLLAPLWRAFARRSRAGRRDVWLKALAGSADGVAVEIDWGGASVRDRRLTVGLTEKPPRAWGRRFRGVVALLEPGRGDWGEVRLKSGTITVANVSEGDEGEIHHFLESVVQQANAEPEPERERELTPPQARDRQLAEAFQAFAREGQPS
jgi:Family of unknown function (DUF6328)